MRCAVVLVLERSDVALFCLCQLHGMKILLPGDLLAAGYDRRTHEMMPYRCVKEVEASMIGARSSD